MQLIFIHGVKECFNFILLHIAVQFAQHHLSPLQCLAAFVKMPNGSVVKNLRAVQETSRRCEIDSWARKIPGEGNGNPVQYFCLGNAMDRGAQWAAVHGVTKSHTQLSDSTTTFVINKLIIHVWVYFWAFYPAPLIYICFLCQYHTLLMIIVLQYSLKSGSLIPPASFLFLKIALAIQGLLCLHTNFNYFLF